MDRNRLVVNSYPNPTTGLCTVTFGSNAIPTDLRITDALGRQVSVEQVRRGPGSLQVDMHSLADGRYTIEFRVDGQRLRSAVVVGR